MSEHGTQTRGGGHLGVRNNIIGLAAIFIALSGTAVAAQVAESGDGAVKAAKKKKKVKRGPPGPAGPQGPQGPAGPATGPAGGALAGSYPNPTLNVTGGPCPNGQELVNVSALAALTCSAGVYSDAAPNVAAGPISFPALTIGVENTAVGAGTLDSVTDGNFNSALGRSALTDNTGGDSNSGFGTLALSNNTSGNRNTAVGDFALLNNATASDNSALGQGALQNNTGANNTAVGTDAMFANTAGFQNAAIGDDALDANTNGDGNTAVGQGALAATTTGNGNTALGENAGDALTTGSNNIAIKNPGVAGESNTIRIGTEGTQIAAFIAGIDGNPVGGGALNVLVDSAGELGTVSSSRRVKRDIDPLSGLPALMKLRPVSFRYRAGPPELHYGLLAEQVAKVLPELAVHGADGLPETVQYQELPVLLLAKIQQQQRQINRLMREVRGR